MPAWVIYAHFGALNTGEWVGGVIAKGGQEAQGGWVVPRTSPCPSPRSTPKKVSHWPTRTLPAAVPVPKGTEGVAVQDLVAMRGAKLYSLELVCAEH